MADTETLAPETGNPAVTQVAEAPVPEKTGTVLDGNTPDKEPAPDWAPDWREKMAAGDAKELKRLERMKSPLDLYKSYREIEKKASAGPVKLAPDATPEQLAEYRKANGIPEKPEDYLSALPKGLVIGEADKPLIDDFATRMHGKNASPELVAAALDWWHGAQEKAVAAQAEADKAFNIASADALRAEWGGEYRSNINSITAFLDTAPDGLKDQLMAARLGDGTRLGDNPTALKWLASLAHEANPSGFVSPATGQSQMESIDSQIAEIKLLMRTDRAKYDSPDVQTKYDKLLAAKEKLSARATR